MLFQAGAVAVYGLLDAEVEGVANQGVSDRHLVEERYLLVEEGKVVEVEVVAGVEAEATVACHACRLYEGGYGALAVGSIAGGSRRYPSGDFL